MNAEKRQHVRKPINVTVNINEDTGAISKAISADISRSGMCLYTSKENVEPGQTLSLELRMLVSGKYMNINAAAMVVRKTIHKYHGFTLGVAFMELDDMSNATITSFIGNLKPAPYTA